MIFCLSPLLPICLDGTVPTHKLDGPCCSNARCRMNTWTTEKKVAYRHFWLPARHGCIAESTSKKHQNKTKTKEKYPTTCLTFQEGVAELQWITVAKCTNATSAMCVSALAGLQIWQQQISES